MDAATWLVPDGLHERRHELRQAFESFDTDHSGILSRADAMRAFKKLRMPICEELTAIIERFDANGRVQWQELCRAVDGECTASTDDERPARFAHLHWPPTGSETIVILSQRPRLALFPSAVPGRLTAELRALANELLAGSVDDLHPEARYTSSRYCSADVREAHNMRAMDELEALVTSLCRSPGLWSEPPAITRYFSGAVGYGWHHDDGGHDPPRRAATAIAYLNSVSSGGETYFWHR